MRLILLDLKMPGAMGYSGIALLHAERPDVPILVVSSAEGAGVADEARQLGAVGFLSKDSDLDAIETRHRARAGRAVPPRPCADPGPKTKCSRTKLRSLTPTQLKVLIEVLDGKLNKQIAHDLGMSEATVKAHMTIDHAQARRAEPHAGGAGRALAGARPEALNFGTGCDCQKPPKYPPLMPAWR